MMGLFHELGPCKPNLNGANVVDNKYSLTKGSNVLYVDQVSFFLRPSSCPPIAVCSAGSSVPSKL